MKKFFPIGLFAALVLLLSFTVLVSCQSGACEHAAGDGVIKNYTSAGCEEPGGYDRVVCCEKCGKELSRVHSVIAALGHEIVHHDGKEPATCTSEGWEAYDTCSRCDYSTYKALYASHTPGTERTENEVAPSCGRVGGYDRAANCTVCGEEVYRIHTELEALTHDYGAPAVTENVVEAKCDREGGYDIVVYCGVCGEELERLHVTVSTAEHTPGGVTEENKIEPTCSTDGGLDKVVRCTDCGVVMSRMHVFIPREHTPVEAVRENIIEPVYGYGNRGTDGGFDEVVYCGICGEVLKREHIITKITAEEYYSQFDYLELSATANTIDALVDNHDGTYTMTAKTAKGKSVRLLIVGEFGELEGGWGSFGKNTQVYFLDALPGVNFIDCEFTSPVNEFIVKGYYNLRGATSVASVSELFPGNAPAIVGRTSQAEFEQYPDYICLNASTTASAGTEAEALSIRIYYCDVMSKIAEIKLDTRLYRLYSPQSYVAGDRYDAAIEKIGIKYGFPLLLRFDNSACLSGPSKIYCENSTIDENVTFGRIKDADGNIVDKTNRFLREGDKIEVTIGDCTEWLDLCKPTFKGNLYEASDVCYIKSTGTQNVLVIPVTFLDQKDRVNDEWLAALRSVLGNVTDKDGNVNKYALDNCEISLSEFLSTSSYGKLTVNSFITEPYVIQGNAADYYDIMISESELFAIGEWLGGLGINNSAFDQNGDGYYDVVILVNTLLYGDGTEQTEDYYKRMGMSGGFMYSVVTDTRYAGTKEKPAINTILNIASHFIFKEENGEEVLKTYTLIHEFGHALGLEDYYSNVEGHPSAIGKFDMEADNAGDWNSYTKYLLGWIEPVVVDPAKDKTEITVKAYSKHGDAVLIRAVGYDGNGTPYDEYILIDLFAHDGLYAKNAKAYGLDKTVGIRIYHVNSAYDMKSITWKGEETVTARPHHGMEYSKEGTYLIELIQNGNVGTFMSGVTSEATIDASDLFYAGDSFSVDAYDNFFVDGKMDNGMAFGYTITVKEIVDDGEDSTATLIISKNAA